LRVRAVVIVELFVNLTRSVDLPTNPTPKYAVNRRNPALSRSMDFA
jgi:hypothetical protein